MKRLFKKSIQTQENVSGLLFILPILLQLIVFVLFPLGASFYYSFTRFDALMDPVWCGINNYRELLFGEYTLFWKALGNTCFLLIGVPIGMFLALLFATMLNRKFKGNQVFRVIFYIPCICSAVAVSIMWKWIFNHQYGILNYMLSWFGINGPNWLWSETFVKPAFIIMGVWSGLGTSIILYLSSIQSISKEYYEAAEIDGASGVKTFFSLTLPLVSPVTFYLLIFGVIGTLQGFIPTYMMTPNGGTNNSSTTLVFLLWNKAFNGGEMGYASAIAWILAVLIFALTAVQFKFQDKWVHTAD